MSLDFNNQHSPVRPVGLNYKNYKWIWQTHVTKEKEMKCRTGSLNKGKENVKCTNMHKNKIKETNKKQNTSHSHPNKHRPPGHHQHLFRAWIHFTIPRNTISRILLLPPCINQSSLTQSLAWIASPVAMSSTANRASHSSPRCSFQFGQCMRSQTCSWSSTAPWQRSCNRPAIRLLYSAYSFT